MSRKVLVTAGASGIGKHIAAAFIRSGADVYTCDIDAEALKSAAAELKGLKTGICNVGDRMQIERMGADVANKLGGIDVLVNNAGISGPTAPVQEVDPDQWEQVLKVDLTGTFIVTKNAIPHLVRSGNGVIINVSSAAGRFGYPNRSPYSTVRWGLIGFTKTLSMELGEHNIRANAILPGAVDGERIQRVFEGLEEIKAIAMENQSIKRTISPHLQFFLRPTRPSPFRDRRCRSMRTCRETENEETQLTGVGPSRTNRGGGRSCPRRRRRR